ncbi:unnamed protein product, partial [Prorocentrum cordatum]
MSTSYGVSRRDETGSERSTLSLALALTTAILERAVDQYQDFLSKIHASTAERYPFLGWLCSPRLGGKITGKSDAQRRRELDLNCAACRALAAFEHPGQATHKNDQTCIYGVALSEDAMRNAINPARKKRPAWVDTQVPDVLNYDPYSTAQHSATSCFAERVQTMVNFGQRRDAMMQLRGVEKSLVCSDLACLVRVNPRSRLDAKATVQAYEHYEKHLRRRAGTLGLGSTDLLLEFLLNVALMRNTLGDAVRAALAEKSWVWLEVAHATGCKGLFGDYVNPMRTRGERPVHGFADLLADLHAFQAVGVDLVSAFAKDLDVPKFFEGLQSVRGYSGSGFRAKELLCDFVDCLSHALGGDLSGVQEQYKLVTVIGVGPC